MKKTVRSQYIYKGFEVRQDGKNFDIRRPGGHWVQAVRNAASIDQAAAQVDSFIFKANQKAG